MSLLWLTGPQLHIALEKKNIRREVLYQHPFKIKGTMNQERNVQDLMYNGMLENPRADL